MLFGFVAALGLGLLGDLRQVGSQVQNFQWRLYPFVFALTLVNYTLRFLKWHYYLHQIDAAGIGWLESARLFVASFPLSVTPGKVGEALKGVWLNQKSGAPVARGLAVVVAERISDGIAVLILSALGVFAYPQYWPLFAFALSLLLGLVIVSQVRPLAYAILDFGRKIPLVSRFIPPLYEFYEGSFVLFKPSATVIAVGLGTISWFWEGVGFYLILQGLGVAGGWNTLAIAVFILAFSTVIGALSTLPGGLGAAELSIAGMLVLLMGVSADVAAAATLLIRFATLWFGVGLGLVVWLFSRDLIFLQEKAA